MSKTLCAESSYRRWYRARSCVAACVGAALLSTPAAHASDVDPWDGSWHTQLSVYGWLPGISAKTRFRGDVALMYRDTEYHQHGNDHFLRDVRLSGPSLNLTWQF